MTEEELAVVDRVTEKLVGRFYVGQRVQVKFVDETRKLGPGTILSIARHEVRQYANWIADDGRTHCTFLWALEPA